MSEIIRSFVIENRPRLRSLNFFITLHDNVADKCKISSQSNSIIVTNEKRSEIIDTSDFSIIENSLTSYLAKENFITFRYLTNSKQFGSFKTEVLQPTKSKLKFKTAKPPLNSNYSYNLKCFNCDKNLSDYIFDRILPLPSEHSEPNDWFCHAHENTQTNLDPKTNELFYTTTYFHMNAIKKLDISKKIIKCPKCFKWLGVELKDNVHKFWFNTIKFNDSLTNPLTDCFKLLQEVVSDNLAFKVILNYQRSETKSAYLLLWLLEKDLNVTIRSSSITENIKVCKVFYKFEDEYTDLVETWGKEPTISNLSVSKNMMHALVGYLKEMHLLIPRDFSLSNDFFISYLKLY